GAGPGLQHSRACAEAQARGTQAPGTRAALGHHARACRTPRRAGQAHLTAEACMNSGRASTFFCRENRPRRDSHAFEDGRDALAAADAHGLEAVAGLAAVHLAQHGGQDPAAGGADGMAERDARTVDIESIEVALAQAPFASDGE